MGDEKLVVLEHFAGYRRGDVIDADDPFVPLMRTCTIEQLRAAMEHLNEVLAELQSLDVAAIKARSRRLRRETTDKEIPRLLSELSMSNYPGVR